MYDGMPLSQLEAVETIPQGSIFPMVAGDGSGTKKVTMESLVKETGNALKIGNLAELQTENKENLVAAINEATQSGGSAVSVDILDSKEEIEANTEAGKAAGASAVKEMFAELNDKLTQIINSLKWKKVKEVTGTTAINISDITNTANELLICVITGSFQNTAVIPVDGLTSGSLVCNLGNHGSTSMGTCKADVYISKVSVNIWRVYDIGSSNTDTTSTAKLAVYYR